MLVRGVAPVGGKAQEYQDVFRLRNELRDDSAFCRFSANA